jgi:type IV pilus assembly protein PilC
LASIDISKYSARTVTAERSEEVSLSSNMSKILQSEIKLFEKKFGQKQKEWLYTEIGLLLSAGVDIKTAFEIIENETADKKHKMLIVQIKNDVISGSSIAQALSKHNNIFTNYECQSVKIGEETGKLPEVLNELGKFYNGAIKLRRQIIGTLTYPLIVISLAILIVYFMLSFVVPMFSDIFKQTGGQLPATTQFLISVSNKSSSIFYSLVLIVGGFILLHKTQSKKIWYRSYTSLFFLKIPLINNLIKKIYLARFCQSMRLLLGAKVLLIEALALVRNMIEYYPIEHALETVEKDVLAGKTLNESLSQHIIFPQKLTALIKVSEEVNAPELIFEKLSKQYSEEIEHQQAIVGKVIEPFFIIVLGLIIGFILVAMYMPLFQLSNGF